MYFERALELTDRRDLGVLVDYARGYARLVYDRELHDQLLNEALQADPRQPGYTLFNILAQRQAAELLASARRLFLEARCSDGYPAETSRTDTAFPDDSGWPLPAIAAPRR